MTRFERGQVLPVPVPVAQRLARLPDGALDPDADSDCGEACVASVLSAATGFLLSPGCVRDALALRSGTGVTTARQLTTFLSAMGVATTAVDVSLDGGLRILHRLRHYGRYAIVLGDWVAEGVGHWVLAYEKTPVGFWVMDPWSGAHVLYTDEVFISRFAGIMAVSRIWS